MTFNFRYFSLGDFSMGTGFSCNQCGHNYKYKKDLKRHLDYECQKEAQFSCPVCPSRRKRKSDIYKHARDKHGLELVMNKMS